MATNDDYEENLQILVKKQLEEQEKMEQKLQQLRDEIEKIKREAEEIELTKESKYQNKIEKMKSEAWDINQIQVAIDKHKINKRIRELAVLMKIEKTKEQIGPVKQQLLETEKRFNEIKLREINEKIREEFDHLIFNLLNTSNNNTSLKYLNTSSSYYLEDKFNPDCTFIYKNINIKINKEDSFLQDFIVCIGNLKSPNISLSEDSIIEEILHYLKIILTIQHREIIHGFLSNYTHIKFFRVHKDDYSNSYEYFQSQEFEMFNYLSETLSSIDTSVITENKRKLGVNKDTWKMFIKFLMVFGYYDYEGLEIEPNDDLLGDRYMLTKKLVNGYNTMSYLLEKNQDNHSTEDSSHYVMKILETNGDSELLLNEVKITKILKRFNNSNKFHLFFQNIIDRPSSSINHLLYEKELQCIESLSLIQAKQFIDIIHYLYDCRIIHRGVTPKNLMLDRDTNHIKLIDFSFAIQCNMANKGGSIYILGPFTYTSQSFLNAYLKVLTGNRYNDYCYEPTFDLISALNIIMTMNNVDIKQSIDSIDILEDEKERISQSLQLWKDILRTNKHYSNLLNLINKLDIGDSFYKSDELSVSDILKDESIESDQSSISNVSIDESIESDQSSISNVSKNQSDPSAIFDVIKDEIEKLFDI
ncbi:unnamed protein product [Rotaria sp. Silwood1]|nr:unnamed protein product [Rotaria sp. Silwood1]